MEGHLKNIIEHLLPGGHRADHRHGHLGKIHDELHHHLRKHHGQHASAHTDSLPSASTASNLPAFSDVTANRQTSLPPGAAAPPSRTAFTDVYNSRQAGLQPGSGAPYQSLLAKASYGGQAGMDNLRPGSTPPSYLPGFSIDDHGRGARGAAAPSRTGFGAAFLQSIGAPLTSANYAFLDAWQRQEGGPPSNPFNTSQPAEGATIFNRDKVRRYPDMQTGIAATVKTVTNGRYNGIIAALRDGNNPRAAANALERSPWGTHGLRV